MYTHWPYFRTLIDNAQMSLAKTDLYIADQYAGLIDDDKLKESICRRLHSEHRLCIRKILEITNQKQLLTEWPVLRKSIHLRNPYVDPLNFIQIHYLKKFRSPRFASLSSAQREKIIEILLLTVNGISFGMKSTG